MRITASYTLTPAEALDGTRAFKRTWYGLSVASGGLMLLMGFTSLNLAPGAMGLFMLFNGVLFLVLPEAVLRWGRHRRGTSTYAPVELELDDEGLVLRTQDTTGGLPWPAFAAVRRQSGFWMFRITHSQAILVPERALAEADATELEAFLRERKLLKG